MRHLSASLSSSFLTSDFIEGESLHPSIEGTKCSNTEAVGCETLPFMTVDRPNWAAQGWDFHERWHFLTRRVSRFTGMIFQTAIFVKLNCENSG
jgi:hypothetical protein